MTKQEKDIIGASLLVALWVMFFFFMAIGAYVITVQSWTDYFTCMQWMQVLGGLPCHVFSPFVCEMNICVYATLGAGIVERGVTDGSAWR